MSAKKPKPIRLTKARAEALLTIFDRAVKQERDVIRAGLGDPAADLDQMRRTKELDMRLARALDAAQIIRERYVGAPTTKETDTLF